MVARRAESQQLTEEEIARAGRWLYQLPSPSRHWQQSARLATLKPTERHCDNPDMAAAADYLAVSGERTTQAEIVDMIKDPRTLYDVAPHGIMAMAGFLHRSGMVAANT